jgi:adenylate kinase
VRIVLLGPPGAGKGTQAHRLAERYELDLIATGDTFRWNVQNDTELGREATSYMDAGELVPDDVVVRMVVHALSSVKNGFILDGFPRTLTQAQALEASLGDHGSPLSAVLVFRLDDEVAVKRLAGRRTCPSCQRTYNVEFHPPKSDMVCDYDGTELVQRRDDEEHTVRHRLDVFKAASEQLERFYATRGLVRVVDADAVEDEVTGRATAALDDLAEHLAGG